MTSGGLTLLAKVSANAWGHEQIQPEMCGLFPCKQTLAQPALSCLPPRRAFRPAVDFLSRCEHLSDIFVAEKGALYVNQHFASSETKVSVQRNSMCVCEC